MNTIFVRELRVETRIGIYAWEQHLAQPLLIDLELALPSAKAFASDDFADSDPFDAGNRRKLGDADADPGRSELGANELGQGLGKPFEQFVRVVCRKRLHALDH